MRETLPNPYPTNPTAAARKICEPRATGKAQNASPATSATETARNGQVLKKASQAHMLRFGGPPGDKKAAGAGG